MPFVLDDIATGGSAGMAAGFVKIAQAASRLYDDHKHTAHHIGQLALQIKRGSSVGQDALQVLPRDQVEGLFHSVDGAAEQLVKAEASKFQAFQIGTVNKFQQEIAHHIEAIESCMKINMIARQATALPLQSSCSRALPSMPVPLSAVPQQGAPLHSSALAPGALTARLEDRQLMAQRHHEAGYARLEHPQSIWPQGQPDMFPEDSEIARSPRPLRPRSPLPQTRPGEAAQTATARGVPVRSLSPWGEQMGAVEQGWPVVTEVKKKAEETAPMCEHGSNCPIFRQCKESYQFSEEALIHLTTYYHGRRTTCRFGAECKAHIRLMAGGARLDDQCHASIYEHP